MDRLNIITFNDDNHAERVWINGRYVGDTSNIVDIIKNSVVIIKDLNDDFKIEETNVWVCEDFDEVDEETAEYIWDFFDNVKEISEKEMKMISEKNWEELRKIVYWEVTNDK